MSADDAMAELLHELEAVSRSGRARGKRPRPEEDGDSDDVGGATSSEEEDGEADQAVGGAGAGAADDDDEGDGVAGRAEKALGWDEPPPTAEEERLAAEAAGRWRVGEASAHVARLSGPLAQWRCLDPFGVLQLSENASLDVARARFKRLSAAVHPDKHAGSDAANAAFHAVKAAMEAIKDPERRRRARSLVRDGRRKAAKWARRERRDRAKGAKRARGEVSDEELAEATAREILKAFAGEEHRRRTLESSLRSEARAEAQQVDEERAAFKREVQAEKEWDEKRKTRVGSWRKFQDSGAARAGLKRDKVTTYGSKAAADAAKAKDGESQFRSTWR